MYYWCLSTTGVNHGGKWETISQKVQSTEAINIQTRNSISFIQKGR